MKLLTIILFMFLVSGILLFLSLINQEKRVDLDKFEKVVGTIVSAAIYKERIKTELRSLNSGIPQTTFDERWKLTIGYTYTINENIYFRKESLLSNSGIIGYIKGNKPENLFEKLKNNVTGNPILIYYDKKYLEHSFINL